MGLTHFSHGLMGTPNVGADLLPYFESGNVWFVDGDIGIDGKNSGQSPDRAVKTIGQAVLNATPGGVIYVKTRDTAVGATAPLSYAETLIIPPTKPGIKIIGIGAGRAKGGLPQMKIGAGAAAMITVRAPGCLIMNMGFDGVSSTGGGVLMDDDGGTTKSSFGLCVVACDFINCVGSTATNAATGGAIYWATAGGIGSNLFKGNRFFNNVGDICLVGTGTTIPADVVIEDNIFSGPAASVDCNILASTGSGITGLVIRNNSFTCWPAIGSGTNVMPVSLTGCVGILDGNRFASSGKTYGAAANALVPTTMFLAMNYQEGGLIART